MLDDMVDYIADIRQRPVWQAIPDDVRARFRAGLPEEPGDLDIRLGIVFCANCLPFAKPSFW